MTNINVPMNASEFEELIELGKEQAGVEFKGPGRRDDKHFFAKVTRAVLAMANRRDGGHVIIGIDDQKGRAIMTGLTEEERATWANADNVCDALTVYAEPSVEVSVDAVCLHERHYVVLGVREFTDVPVLCRKDGDGLREGEIYIRPRRKPESVPVPRQAEMRDLLDLATEKRLRSFLVMAARAGVTLAPNHSPAEVPLSGEARHADERRGITSATIEKAKTRGYWEFGIWPEEYDERRVGKVTDLFDIVDGCNVQYRGWPYPAVLPQHPVVIGANCAGQDVDSGMHVEGWRLFQSGQFLHVLGLWDDWQEENWFRDTTRPTPTPGTALSVVGAIYTLTEFFEFASRLAFSLAGSPRMRLRVTIHGLAQRALSLDSDRAPFIESKTASIDEFLLTDKLVTAAELVEGSRKMAAQTAQELFQRFGWDAQLDALTEMQRQLRQRP